MWYCRSILKYPIDVRKNLKYVEVTVKSPNPVKYINKSPYRIYSYTYTGIYLFKADDI